VSPLALAAAGLFGLWLLASLCYACRVPVAFDTLRRWNACRFLSNWTMFGARTPDETGAYVLECCDRRAGELPIAWTILLRGHHWHPLAFLCHPQAVEAAAIQQIGRYVHQAARGVSQEQHAQDLRRFQSILIRHAAHVHAPDPGGIREFRLVKQQGSPRTRPDRLIWWFAAGSGRRA
jgi:hypothetical protein